MIKDIIMRYYDGNCGLDFWPMQASGNKGRRSWVKTYPL
jgi:hypothetical protein